MLQVASKLGSKDVVQYLLERSADVDYEMQDEQEIRFANYSMDATASVLWGSHCALCLSLYSLPLTVHCASY